MTIKLLNTSLQAALRQATQTLKNQGGQLARQVPQNLALRTSQVQNPLRAALPKAADKGLSAAARAVERVGQDVGASAAQDMLERATGQKLNTAPTLGSVAFGLAANFHDHTTNSAAKLPQLLRAGPSTRSR